MPPLPSALPLPAMEALAAELAAEAGIVLLTRFRTALDVRFKDARGYDPVTDVDHAIEAMVREAVQERFPAHAVLGEEAQESGPDEAEVVWAVDPLDGTANFINGLPLFSCSIGVLWRGIPVAGAIFAPVNRHLEPGVYHAARGGGLRFNVEPVRFTTPPLAQANRLSAVPGGAGGVSDPRGRRFGVARTLGSIALELAFTAEGTFRYCAITDGRLWDVAAGALLCLEAGAAVYVRPRGRRGWTPLESFAAPGGESGPARLRAWNNALTAGDRAVVPALGAALAREQRAPAVLRRLITRQR